MRLGISSYTFTWAVGVPGYPVKSPLSPLGLLDKAVEMGVSVVQIADNLPLDDLSKQELSDLVRGAEMRGIQVEVGTRGIQPAQLITYLNLAEGFNSPILRVVIDTANHNPTPLEVIDILRKSIPAFEASGTILAIENHDRFSVGDFQNILKAVDSPCLGICLDTVNSFGALEGPEMVVTGLAPWTVNLHVKDFKIQRVGHQMGFTIEGSPAGRGRLDIPWVLEKLKPYGRDFNVILELWTPPVDNVDATVSKEAAWAQESINYLRNYIIE